MKGIANAAQKMRIRSRSITGSMLVMGNNEHSGSSYANSCNSSSSSETPSKDTNDREGWRRYNINYFGDAKERGRPVEVQKVRVVQV